MKTFFFYLNTHTPTMLFQHLIHLRDQKYSSPLLLKIAGLTNCDTLLS